MKQQMELHMAPQRPPMTPEQRNLARLAPSLQLPSLNCLGGIAKRIQYISIYMCICMCQHGVIECAVLDPWLRKGASSLDHQLPLDLQGAYSDLGWTWMGRTAMRKQVHCTECGTHSPGLVGNGVPRLRFGPTVGSQLWLCSGLCGDTVLPRPTTLCRRHRTRTCHTRHTEPGHRR